MQRRSVLTDRAVLAVPSLLALALPVAAGAVPHALGAADALVAAHACPALFAVAHTTHAHPVGPAVGRTHLCPKEREKEREKERRWARTRGVETTLIQETPKRQERERERGRETERLKNISPLTCGAVRAHPVGVTAADARVRDVSPMAVALIRARCPGDVAQRSCPACLTVALPTHTGAMPRAFGVEAVH